MDPNVTSAKMYTAVVFGVLCFAYRPLSQRQILFVSQCVSVSECPFEDEMTRDISPRIGR